LNVAVEQACTSRVHGSKEIIDSFETEVSVDDESFKADNLQISEGYGTSILESSILENSSTKQGLIHINCQFSLSTLMNY